MAVRSAFPVFVVLLAVALALSVRPVAAAPDDFPEYPSIRGHVDFWTQVFGVWSLGQVAVHDMDNPAVVYAVVDLPGNVEEHYTTEQREFVDDLNEQWQDRLRNLEDKVQRNAPLTDNEKIWVLALTTNAGTDAVEGAHRRVRTQRGVRERFRRGLEISHTYDASFRRILKEKGLPEEIANLPHVESSFQARARSAAGAVGIWQFTRSAGRRYMKINSSVDERLDPVAAAYGAADYLADAFAELGDWPIALTSYNHGVAGMARAVRDHGADYETIFSDYRGKAFGFASRNFYSEFLAVMRIAANPEKYFPEGFMPDPPHSGDALILEQHTTPFRLAEAFGVSVDELVAINPAWSERAVKGGYALPEGHRVWLPAGTLRQLAGPVDYADLGAPDGDDIYIVRRGDTLAGIAAAHSMRVSLLRDLNDIPGRSSLIRVGQRLRVAGGSASGRGAGDRPPDTHVVRRGENLSTIAARYGTTVSALRAANGIAAGSSVIHTGQRLRIETTSPASVHVVRRGDNLSDIATRYGVALGDLLRANGLSPSSTIHPGQTVRIPG